MQPRLYGSVGLFELVLSWGAACSAPLGQGVFATTYSEEDFVSSYKTSLGQVKTRVFRVGWDDHHRMAKIQSFICETSVFTTEDDRHCACCCSLHQEGSSLTRPDVISPSSPCPPGCAQDKGSITYSIL